MSAVLIEAKQVLSVPPIVIDGEFLELLKLRTSLILDHPLNRAVGRDPGKLFLMFELYANFVYDFTEYVCRLFMALRDEDMKAVIYENLTDEIGLCSSAENAWKTQHGELYRQFIHSLRRIEPYKATGLDQRIGAVEVVSKAISDRFYNAHGVILAEGNDLQSFAAFSTIECWVCDLYAFWKRSLLDIGGDHLELDMRTIDLHCVCDVEHSVALDGLLRSKSDQNCDALHSIKKGVIRGMAASEQLFSDLHKELA